MKTSKAPAKKTLTIPPYPKNAGQYIQCDGSKITFTGPLANWIGKVEKALGVSGQEIVNETLRIGLAKYSKAA